jgi:hypothetical protein
VRQRIKLHGKKKYKAISIMNGNKRILKRQDFEGFCCTSLAKFSSVIFEIAPEENKAFALKNNYLYTK